MLKKLSFTLLLLFSLLNAEPFSKQASIEPLLVQDGSKKIWCNICGMNLKMFYKTSYISGDKQYCSIRCLIADMPNNPTKVEEIKVIDAKTEKPIIAKDAFFVMGSDVKGTMSKVSKLAFKNEEDAKAFAKEHGGEVVNFDTVLKEAKSSLNSDSAMVNMKKQKMMYPMGEKLLSKRCQGTIDPNHFHEINELKAEIKTKNICKDINEKQLQAVTLYLWDIKREKKEDNTTETIHLTKEDKCPVCGMFVYKFPKWASQIVYKDGAKLSFDGVKDMMKFYFDRNQYGKFETFTPKNIDKILVTDYYSQKPIDGKRAFYVMGSDITGPMGNELIPFKQESDAKTFMSDHHGKKIASFEKITKKEILQLDR